MDPLAIHDSVARALLEALLIAWAAAELALRVRSRGGRSASDWTYFVIAATVVAGFAVAVRGEHVRSTVLGGGWADYVPGLVLLVLGVALRVWAILTLGRLFKVVVVIQPDHRVIDSGPYRLVRHPSYTGALIALLGVGVALDSWLALLALVLLPLLGLVVRIRVEEAALERALGDEYRAYAARRRRLLPGLW